MSLVTFHCKSTIRDDDECLQRKSKRFARCPTHCATDDMPLSLKTNSASPADCGIASLVRQGQIIPSTGHSLQGEELWKPSFLEGTDLNQRTCGFGQ